MSEECGALRMRRSGGFKRGRWVSICVAGLIGFLLGNWHATASRQVPLSPAQNVALRFLDPKTDDAAEDFTTAVPAGPAAPADPVGVAGVVGAAASKDAQLALLNPTPMAPVLQPVTQPAPREEASAEAAAPEAAETPAAAAPPRAAGRAERAAAEPWNAARPAASTARRAARPGFVLNDAQIARIKARLHLRPDQEGMWPAVEAALRNVAYAKAREARSARRHAASGLAVAAADNSDDAAVQGLKSAATPLIMSFSDEQRNEVRSIAHVMGLDKLASEL